MSKIIGLCLGVSFAAAGCNGKPAPVHSSASASTLASTSEPAAGRPGERSDKSGALVNAASALEAAPACEVETRGAVEIDTFRSSLGAGATVMTVARTLDPQSNAFSVDRTIAIAGREALHEKDTSAGPNSTVTVDYEAGFSGLRHLEARGDGRTMRVTMDGHVLAAYATVGKPPAVDQAGSSLPELHPEAGVLEAVVAIEKQAQRQASSCVAKRNPGLGSPDLAQRYEAANAGKAKPRDAESSICNWGCGLLGGACTCCMDCCEIPYWTCNVAATTALAACEAGSAEVATPVCVLGYLAAGGECTNELGNCGDACESGKECCGPSCGEGHPSQDCPYDHCSPGAVCCGGDTCCNNQNDCCGSVCLEGIFSDDRCIDPTTGNFCPKDSGDVCGVGCCPPSSPTCRQTTPQELCCASNAGDVCRGGTECCPVDTPQCVDDGQCCGATDVVCGSGSPCCPSPGVCAGNSCCNPPSTVCGTSCCDANQTCTSVRNICCGGDTFGSTPCGNDCCVGGEVCLDGACCPSTQACGDTCCPTGQSCLNGACSVCGAGLTACQANPQAAVICCASGSCCPTLCCPEDETCCDADATQCCVNQ